MKKTLVVVSNAGPLISLSLIQRFDLLRKLYGKVIISSAVYREVATKGSHRAGHKEVKHAVKEGWLFVRSPKDALAVSVQETYLDAGEAETIVLAQEAKADIILLDERKARAAAQLLGLRVAGTVGVLMDARKQREAIDLKKSLDALRKKGFRLDEMLYQRILREM